MVTKIEECRPAVSALARLSRKMSFEERRVWEDRLTHVYGDMKGQRAVDFNDIVGRLFDGDEHFEIADVVIGLEAFFFLACTFLARSSLEDNPGAFIREACFDGRSLMLVLDDVVSGRCFSSREIFGFEFGFEFDWIACGRKAEDYAGIASGLSQLAELWDESVLKIPGNDPLQVLHHALFPKNLLHIGGQFYTPEWLADLLLDDVAWEPSQRLIDPFCGSGVFLVTALHRAVERGYNAADVLKNLVGFDLNPIACFAARCNIVLYLAARGLVGTEAFHLNICAADSIEPALGDVGLFEARPFDTTHALTSKASDYGLSLDRWLDADAPESVRSPAVLSHRSCSGRRQAEAAVLARIRPAHVVATNPPWVGWEYISRPYRAHLMPAWQAYDLFTSKGIEAAFLKEDLSTLALLVAWDRYLADDGRSAVVLRAATMFSDTTARGVRRLSIDSSGDTPLRLDLVRTFSRVNVFESASTDTTAWLLTKGVPTVFPVRAIEWAKSERGWQPASSASRLEIEKNVRAIEHLVMRTETANLSSRWLISDAANVEDAGKIQGRNAYVPRMGVFTGGANAVFYLNANAVSGSPLLECSNIIERAKRSAPQMSMLLESELVFPVLRGRDIQQWRGSPAVSLLCCHTEETKMYPLDGDILSAQYPHAYAYLTNMREILDDRQGFAGWEKSLLQRNFYTLQRIGEYTFAPYKVCWKYIASEFTVCVVGISDSGKPIFPNDKVMFLPFRDERAAYFLAGVLSSSRVKAYVNASTTKRQISAGVIRSLALPEFDPSQDLHVQISATCRDGHQAASRTISTPVAAIQQRLDKLVESLF